MHQQKFTEMNNRKHKVIFTCLSNSLDSIVFRQIIDEIEATFGLIKNSARNKNWIAPLEYKIEMGNSLNSETFVFEEKLIKKDIVYLKKFLQYLEVSTGKLGNRKFNLNPGYIGEKGLSLISHKPGKQKQRSNFQDIFWEDLQIKFSKDKILILPNTFSELKNKQVLQLLFPSKENTPDNKLYHIIG